MQEVAGHQPLLDTTEVADWLNVSVQTLHRWACDGGGPPFMKLGNRRRYDAKVVQRWLDEHVVGGP